MIDLITSPPAARKQAIDDRRSCGATERKRFLRGVHAWKFCALGGGRQAHYRSGLIQVRPFECQPIRREHDLGQSFPESSWRFSSSAWGRARHASDIGPELYQPTNMNTKRQARRGVAVMCAALVTGAAVAAETEVKTTKVRLADAHGIRPPYQLEALLNFLPGGSPLAKEVRARERNGIVQLGNDLAWRALEVAQDPLADAYASDAQLQRNLRRRNESMYGHGKEPVDPAAVRSVADRLRNLLREHLPAALACWTTELRPHSLAE